MKPILTTTDWRPDAAQLGWAKNVISLLRDGGCWGAPIMGMFTIDHQHKRLIFQEKSPAYDPEMLQRTVVAFRLCDYDVLNNTGGEIP